MIHEGVGSIFEVGASIIVNPVNMQGISGKGLAKEIKDRYPWAFKDYVEFCASGRIRDTPGLLSRSFVGDSGGASMGSAIWHLPTKDQWRDPSTLQLVEAGSVLLGNALRRGSLGHLFVHRPLIVAVPALGCGLGGLEWKQVLPILWESFSGILGVDIILFPPQG